MGNQVPGYYLLYYYWAYPHCALNLITRHFTVDVHVSKCAVYMVQDLANYEQLQLPEK